MKTLGPSTTTHAATARPAAAVPVLVVEDERDLRAVLHDALADEGYTVHEAPDGEVALQQMQVHPQGMVVVLDLDLPRMSGVAVLRAVAANPDLAQRHRIILTSAWRGPFIPPTDPELVTHYIAFLPKPFSVDAFLSTVADAAHTLDGESSGGGRGRGRGKGGGAQGDRGTPSRTNPAVKARNGTVRC